jgi:(p)ppGpp synthase/HD superfamily hydrolase
MYDKDQQTMIIRAKLVAISCHERNKQTRKYGMQPYGPERYYFHALRVAELVQSRGVDSDIVCAAAIHDVVEDIPDADNKTANQLLVDFGPRVLELVLECTNLYVKDQAQFERRMSVSRKLLKLNYITEEKHYLEYTEGLRGLAIPRSERKKLEAVRISKISDDAKIIKRADIFDNSSAIDQAPAEFAKIWRSEKAEIVRLIGAWED